MSRRGSVNPGATKGKGGYDTTKKRLSKDGGGGRGSVGDIPQIRDGDIYYRTVRSFPSIPEIPEDIYLTVTRSLDGVPLGRETVSNAERRSGKGDRRGSVLATGLREDATTPDDGHNRDRAASVAASIIGQDHRKRGVVIWPEWSDADINAEKWEAIHRGKERKDGKSPVAQQFFDDPDGKVEFPASLKVHHWKRPHDFIEDKAPVIVDQDGMQTFDLLSANETVHESELLRWITCQITSLWKQSSVKSPGVDSGSGLPADPSPGGEGEFSHSWRPWEHIYANTKVGKGPNIPSYNPYGKYVVRLYWLGCWRKVTVDDTIPFDENETILLPCTTASHELWPMLLAKALIKVAAIDYQGGNGDREFGDFSVIQCLTGWLPETIPLQYGHLREIWELLKSMLPEFKLPEPPPEEPDEGDMPPKDQLPQEGTPAEKSEKEKSVVEKPEAKPKEKKEGKGKEGKDKDKKGDKDKDKLKDKGPVQEEIPIPEHPEVVIFASYSGPPKYPARISALAEMADASEKLRQSGLSHLYPHPVLLTQTRSCPLEPPPPPEKLPAWKKIRTPKKKTTPTDEPVEPEVEKPIQNLEVTSQFLNYKVSPVPIPSDTHRPRSSLERGSTRVSSRPGTANAAAIDETDEDRTDTPEVSSQEKLSPTSSQTKSEDIAKPELEQPPTPTRPMSKDKLADKSKKGKLMASGAKQKDSGELTPSPKPNQKAPAGGKSPNKRGSSAGLRDKAATDSKSKMEGKESKDVKQGQQLPPADIPAAENGDQGDVLPLDGVDGEVPSTDEQPFEEEPTEPEVEVKDIWMDFDDFCKCFKTLYIFHKPHTYKSNYKHSDLKNVVPANKEKDKKSAPNTAAGIPQDDKSPHYLFVDSLEPTEIVVSFSTLCRWNEPLHVLPNEKESKSHLKSGKDKGDRDSKAEALTTDSSSILDGISGEPRPPEPIHPGLLVAEQYSWKSLVTGQPVLRLRSTATRSAVLTLPEGRHVLRLNMTAPLAYHMHLCSSVPFVCGDEEKVMTELTKESCRFVENAKQVMLALGKSINNFHDGVAFQQAYREFTAAHCPYWNEKQSSKQYHFKIFNDALYETLRKVLGDAQLSTPEMAWAWRAFNFDLTTPNILRLASGSSRPATGVTTSDRSSAGGKKAKRRDQTDNKVEPWKTREPTADDHVATVKIQKVWRGCYCRKIKLARTPGTDENSKAQELLHKAWHAMEANAEHHGLALFRSMFKVDPDLMPKYRFYKDEWNKVSYTDYQGTFPDQPANNWFIVFRDVLHVTEEMLCVPKLHVPIPTCLMRVVNNDTGEEVPRVFQKVAPFVYKKNKRGYTFVAEARSVEQPVLAGRWRMRLIGALSPLPALRDKSEMTSSFHTRELRDYYLPNKNNIILRYCVKVCGDHDHLASLQMSTSKPDVYIKLVVQDRGEVKATAVGKGHVVLPAFTFLRDNHPDDEYKRSTSRTSNKGGKNTQSKKVAKEGRSSRSSSRHSLLSGDEDEEKDIKPHKYIIQAEVLRNSWPLSESQWVFVQMLKEMEKNELKVAHKDRPTSVTKTDKSTAAKKPDKSKGKGREKDKSPRSPTQQFDYSKPNWTLRFVSDGTAAEDVEVKKDTERADEIRAMKKAWEEAEPGRAAKALQSRLQYLNKNMIQPQESEEDVNKAEPTTEVSVTSRPGSALENNESETILTLDPPRPHTPKQLLPELDLTPFIKKSLNEPRYRDEEEMAKQIEYRQQEFQAYREARNDVLNQREQDRLDRNRSKVKQIELFELMQATLDAARDTNNQPREAFRQKFLEADRKRLEELAAQEAALQAAADKAPSPKGRKSDKGRKSSAGKKKK